MVLILRASISINTAAAANHQCRPVDHQDGEAGRRGGQQQVQALVRDVGTGGEVQLGQAPNTVTSG